MRNSFSANPCVEKELRDIRLGVRHDEMTEQDWVSVWPPLPPISMEDFQLDHDKALEELGISHNEFEENGAVPVDMFQAHTDIVSTFRYLYSNDDDDDGLYGDDEDEQDGDDGDGNMYDALYASRCMGNHARYRRRMDDFRTRARKISAGIGNVVSEGGSNPGFMYVRTQKLERALQKAQFILDLAEDDVYFSCSPSSIRTSEKKLSQAKRNMFKLKRAFIKNSRASKNVIKLASHYSIYCAGYNRYLTDKWAKADVASQDTSSKELSNTSTESSKARKVHDTSEKFVASYDMPSKNQSFVVSHIPNNRVYSSHKNSTHSVTDVHPTTIVDMLPAVSPSYLRRCCFGYGRFY